MKTLLFIVALLAGAPLYATTYYVCAATGSPCNASDSNAGTSKTATWLHAPGMSTATGLASSTTINAGDSLIFRGGDTWNESSGSPQIGTWSFTRSGSSGNVIYIGVDLTWDNSSVCGASWCRPIINGNNPLSTATVSSCSFADDSIVYLSITGSYVTFDNFEFTGDCQTTQSFVEFISLTSGGNHRILSNLYIHGWTLATGAQDDRRIMLNSSDSSTPPSDVATLNVIDGQDSSLGAACTTSSCIAACWNGTNTVPGTCATGWAMGGNWASIDHNVFRHLSDGLQVGNVPLIHDNLLEFLSEPAFGSPCCRHGNVEEHDGNSTQFVAYNNITRNVNEGENWNPAAPVMLFFNNVFENDQHFPPDPNCMLLEPNSGNTSAVITVTVVGNTIDSTCKLGAHAGTWASGSSSSYENNHLVGFTSISNWVACNSQTTCSTTQTDNGGEIFMTTGTATTQNYLLSNDFSPGNGGGTYATVGAGNNLTSTCGTGNFTNDLCSGTPKGCAEVAGSGGFISSCPAITVNARPSSGAWDAGAYEFTAAPASFTCSPTTLPAHHSNNIAVTCTGSGTSWTSATAFSLSGVSGTSLASKANVSSTSYTLQITTGSGTGTLTITDTTDSISTTITVATATLAISPTSGNTGTTPGLTLTGVHTLWTTETALGLFTLSGGSCSGDSITTPTVTSNTAATATLTVGSAACTITVTDSSTTATASFTVVAPSSCTPGTGTYSATQTPACANPNSGTTVQCYTTNGTTPATNGLGTGCTTGTSLTSGGTVSIATNKTLKIIAGTSLSGDSTVTSYTYTFQGSAPTFSPVGGYPPQTVTISQAQSLAMCYTLDGTTPTSNGSGSCSHGTLYSGSIVVSIIETIKAIGMASGWTDSPVGTASFTAGSTVGTGSGSGNFIIENSPTTSFPPTSGPDNYYCSATNQPINGLNGYDDVAQGPQTCMNTAIANTPSPAGLYMVSGSPYTAQSCSDINNIAAGTGGFTQIAAGQTLQVLHTLVATNCNISWAAAGSAGNWITVETDDLAAIPAEGTRITPCFAGISSAPNIPTYPSHNSGCQQVVPILQLAHSTGAGGLAGLKLTTGAQYIRFVGIDFARDGGAWAFASQPTAATPGVYSRTCNATNCVSQVGIGDGTTQGSITSTHQSLSSNSSGVNIVATTPFTSQVSVAQTLYHFGPGNFTVASVVDDTDFTYNETYAQAKIGGGTISTISRTTGCAVTGTYTFSQVLNPVPSAGLTVFVAGVTDTSFNMSSGSVTLTSLTATTGSFTFGYTQAGGSCTASTSSGGELIAVGSPTPNICNSYANNNCNGVVGNDAVQDIMISMQNGVNNIIFDRIMIQGDTWAETSKGLQLGDTDHIAMIDSFCWDLQSYITIGEASDEHCVSGAVQTNTDANSGTYKLVDNFFGTSNQGFLFGGGGQGFLLTQVTLTPGISALITGICAVTCGIPSGTSTQFMAGSTLWPGGSVSNGINQNQTVTCCTTTTNTNDTFTFPVSSAIVCPPAGCTDSSIDMTIGGYLPVNWEIRRNWKYTSLTENPLDSSYNGGGPLPTGGLPFTTKNCNEFKNGSYVLMEGNVCSNSWNTVDQLGASLLVTPKDQSNIAPSAQITNLIYRYNRSSDTNVGLGVSNAIATTGGTAYQGNTMIFHDNVIAELGSPTLTCAYVYLNLTANAVSCYSNVPQQTQAIRSGSPGATSSTPNFIQGNIHFIHNDWLSQNQSVILLTGGPQTNPSGQYGMVWKDSIIGNGNSTPPIGNAGGAGTVSGNVSVTGSGTTVTWVSGGQFLCTTIWGQGTQITINSINYIIAVCTDNTDIVLQTPAPLSASVKYSVSGSCTGSCTGAGNTPSCVINTCWNAPIWDYNAVYGFSANTQTWPGGHTQLYAAATSLGMVNYNNSIPATVSNWASQFAVTSGPLLNAGDDGLSIGANISLVGNYTLNVDVLQ